MKCPNCKQEIENDSIFCEYCGERIIQPTPEQPITEKESENKPHIKKRKWLKPTLFSIGGVALLLAIITFIDNKKIHADWVAIDAKYEAMEREYDKVVSSRPDYKIHQRGGGSVIWFISESGKCGLVHNGEAKKRGLWGMESCQLETLEPCIHDYIGQDGRWYNDPSECRFLVEDNGKMGFVDGDLNWIVPQNYQITDVEHLYGVEYTDKYGDKDGINSDVPHNVFFASGLQPLKSSETGKWGYVDRDGNITIPFVLDDAYPFRNGKARVLHNGMWLEINPEDGGAFLEKQV